MKKTIKRLLFSGTILSLLLILSGCVRSDSDGNPTGIIWNVIGQPMGNLITYFATNLDLGFGLAIILVTIIVRLVILPLGLYQSYKASYQSEKMAYLKPTLEPFQERIRQATTQEEKMAAQTALMAAQKENGVSMFGGMGCLPLLIQMPFFSAMYFATKFTEGISESSFLGIPLGEHSLLLTIIIAALYFGQSWLSVQTMPAMAAGGDQSSAGAAKSMLYTTPLFMAFMGYTMPASVSLYWFVGGVFSIIQQLITHFIIRPQLRKKVATEFEKNPPKTYSNAKQTRKDVTPKANTKAITKNRNRNAGKQRNRN